MEEKKVVLPKPPKELRKASQNDESQKAYAEEVVAEPVENTEVVGEQNMAQTKQKRKLNFEPATNWIGLFVSLAVLGLFVFLLIK